MLTVRALVSDCGLELAAGAAGAERPVRWVHISEHADPTPWLSGGELLLTTGYNLPTPAKQRRYVELLAGGGPRRARLRHRLRPQADAEGDPRRRRGARASPVRGPLRDAVHRDHRARLRAARQRAVRRARARRPRARAARAAGHRGPRARGDPRVDRRRRSAARRSSSIAPAASSHAAPAEPIPTPAATAGLGAEIAKQAPATPPAPFAPETGALAGRALAVPVPGRRGGRPGRLARGDLASASRSATSSASARARRRWSSGSS